MSEPKTFDVVLYPDPVLRKEADEVESFDYDLGDYPLQGRWQIHGIGLPDEVLRQVYATNARRLLLHRD